MFFGIIFGIINYAVGVGFNLPRCGQVAIITRCYHVSDICVFPAVQDEMSCL